MCIYFLSFLQWHCCSFSEMLIGRHVDQLDNYENAIFRVLQHLHHSTEIRDELKL